MSTNNGSATIAMPPAAASASGSGSASPSNRPIFGGSALRGGVGTALTNPATATAVATSAKKAPAKKLTPADVIEEVTIDMLYTEQTNRSRMWLVLLAFSIIALCIYVPVEWAYKSDLYSWGIDALVDMQSDTSTSSKNWFIFVSWFGDDIWYILVTSFTYHVMCPHTGVRFFLTGIIALWWIGLLKTCYAEPRPYWVTLRVEARVCETDFGQVSGHAFGSLVFFMILGRYVDRKIKFWAIAHRWGVFRTLIGTMIAWGGVAFVVINIGISRMFLGLHFPHQVFAGWVYGFAYLMIAQQVEYVFAPWFWCATGLPPSSLTVNERDRLGEVRQPSFFRQCIFWAVIFIVMEGGAVIVYTTMLNRPGGFHISPQWAINIAAGGDCDTDSDYDDNYFDARADYYVMCMSAGAIFGALIGDSFLRSYLPSDWYHLPLKWRLFRWALGVGLAIMILQLFGLSTGGGTVKRVIVNYTLCFFLVGLVLISVPPVVTRALWRACNPVSKPFTASPVVPMTTVATN